MPLSASNGNTTITSLRYFWDSLYIYMFVHLYIYTKDWFRRRNPMSDRFESFQFENVMTLTQDTSSKIIKRFVPSFARKNVSGAISSLRDQSTRKTTKGKLSKKRMDEGVDVRCQSGAMRMAIRTCRALYRSKAVGMRHWCLTLTTVLAQSLPDSWTWSLRLSILCFCLQCAAAGSSQGPGSSEGTRLLLENGRGR